MNWKLYSKKITEGLMDFEFDEEILYLIHSSKNNNQTIFIAGNGGSAALANHYASDISKCATPNWKTNYNRYNVRSLSSDISYITAIANDENYSEIFKQQLINYAKPKDIVMFISSSGNSSNVVKGAEYANKKGLITIGITGFEGGKLKSLCKYNAHLTNQSYQITEDIHAMFGHFLALWLQDYEIKQISK